MIAAGGERISDLGVLRGQAELFGEIASESTAHWAVEAIDPGALKRLGEGEQDGLGCPRQAER